MNPHNLAILRGAASTLETFRAVFDEDHDLVWNETQCDEIAYVANEAARELEALTAENTEIKCVLGDALEDSAMYQRGLAEGRKEAAEESQRLRSEIQRLREVVLEYELQAGERYLRDARETGRAYMDDG